MSKNKKDFWGCVAAPLGCLVALFVAVLGIVIPFQVFLWGRRNWGGFWGGVAAETVLVVAFMTFGVVGMPVIAMCWQWVADKFKKRGDE